MIHFNLKLICITTIFIGIHHYVLFTLHSTLPVTDICDPLGGCFSISTASHHGKYHDSNSHSPPPIHPLTSLILKGRKIVILNIGHAAAYHHGFGSQLMIMALVEIVFKDHQLVIIQSNSETYRYNSTVGFFGGFTVSPALVLHAKGEYEHVLMELTDQGYIGESDSQVKYFDLDNNKNHKGILRFFYKVRRRFCPSGLPENCPDSFTKQKTMKLLSYLNYTTEVQGSINGMIDQNLRGVIVNESIAFHVRRTDKIYETEHHYLGDEYVGLLLTKVPTVAKTVKYCLVATDDLETVLPELVIAVRNLNMTCKVLPIINIPHGTERNKFSDTMHLLAELEVLSNAQYFVGTLNSNIGDLVAHLRISKKSSTVGGDTYSIFNHNSYFVDLV